MTAFDDAVDAALATCTLPPPREDVERLLRAALPVIAQALRDAAPLGGLPGELSGLWHPVCAEHAADFVEGLAHGGPERTASGRVLSGDDFERLADVEDE